MVNGQWIVRARVLHNPPPPGHISTKGRINSPHKLRNFPREESIYTVSKFILWWFTANRVTWYEGDLLTGNKDIKYIPEIPAVIQAGSELRP